MKGNVKELTAAAAASMKSPRKIRKDEQLRKLREMPFAKVKVTRPKVSKVIIGISTGLSVLALGYVATKLGGNKIHR